MATTEVSSFRRPEEAMLTQSAASVAEEEWPFVPTLIPLKYLLVDDRYQRPPREQFIARQAAVFDETLAGVLDVAERGERYAILDGQQRMRMMEKVGKTTAWCAVYGEMDLRAEAEFFWKKNTERGNVKPYYKFRARVVAGEPRANRTLGIVHSCGYDIAPVSNESDEIGSITAVENVAAYKSENHQECLTPTLITMRESIFGRPKSTDADIIRGLGQLWRAFGEDEVDTDRLQSAIATAGAPHILGVARDRGGATGQSSRGGQVARVILDLYNAGGRGKLDAGRLAK